MGEHTGIAWTDHTFNPWWGCSKVSQGCRNCYAETLSVRFHGDRLWGVGGDRKIASEATWREPLRWNRQAEAAGKRSLVFCASMADVFERHGNAEVNAKLDAARARLWMLIEATPHLDWQLLTKRPENIFDMVPDRWCAPGAMAPNVWLGASVCGDRKDDEMVAHLHAASAALMPAVTFLSYEPAVGPPDFLFDPLGAAARVDWIIVGGESGANARPFHADWARDVIRYAKHAQTRVFVKQMGAALIDERNGVAGCQAPPPPSDLGITVRYLNHRAGADPSEWPGELRVQEFPAGKELSP